MEQLEVENNLREVVGRIINEVELATDQGRTDINLALEDALIPILKSAYNLPHLENMNRVQRNYPGIDLGDDHDRVCFQISATTTLAKVKKTLSTFIDKRYFNDFDELYVLVLVKKQSSYSQPAADSIVNNNFTFSTRKHIIDLGDVLKQVAGLRMTAQKSILREFKLILGDVVEYRTLLDSPVPLPTELVINLAAIRIPQSVYVAAVDIDEKAVLLEAKTRLHAKRKKYSKQSIIRMALVLNGFETTSWIYHGKRIFSFTPIEGSQLESLVDIGTCEELSSPDLYDSNIESNINLFKQLLSAEIAEQLAMKNVRRERVNRFFYFEPNQEGHKIRNEQWVGKKKAKRTVYEQIQRKKDPSKIAYCKHLSFGLSFMRYGQQWYVSIVPSWYYTYKGRKSTFHDELLSTQKRLEFNNSVRNHVRFIAFFLKELGDKTGHGLLVEDLIQLESLMEQENRQGGNED